VDPGDGKRDRAELLLLGGLRLPVPGRLRALPSRMYVSH